ncbi:MAG TPA: hypothetical protein VFT21_10680 [Gemmatimonadaceae bacterium]|nr:hypothetical protein [Gemmatimonadaceae bacterium]
MTYHLDLLERPSSAVERRRQSGHPFQFTPTPLIMPLPSRRRSRRRIEAMATSAVPFSSNLGTTATLMGVSSILLLQLMMIGLFILSL